MIPLSYIHSYLSYLYKCECCLFVVIREAFKQIASLYIINPNKIALHAQALLSTASFHSATMLATFDAALSAVEELPADVDTFLGQFESTQMNTISSWGDEAAVVLFARLGAMV